MKINQENFVKELRRGNEKALLYVIDEYGGLLRSVIRRHLFALPDRQEECMNDVLLGIWNYSRDFDETRNTFQNWAAGVARYKSIDYLRKYKRELGRGGYLRRRRKTLSRRGTGTIGRGWPDVRMPE